MTFLLMLLLIFFYIFAVAGVYFFESYTRSTRQDLEYHMFFSYAGLGEAWVGGENWGMRLGSQSKVQ